MALVKALLNKVISLGSKNREEVWAVICAAGSSSRMGQDKLTMELGGKPVLLHSVMAMEKNSDIDGIVVVVHKDKLVQVSEVLHNCPKVKAVVAGGDTRTESVANGLAALPDEAFVVAVHDGARPFVTDRVITEAINAAKTYGAAIPAIPVKDTIKKAKGNTVSLTPDRSELMAVQTPQVFHKDILRAAISNVMADKLTVTDDAQAVELLGLPVYLTPGDEKNIKLTTPFDIVVAEAMLREHDA